MDDDDYLRDLMRGGGSDSDDDSEDGRPAPGASARGGGVEEGAFAALALGGVHGSESSSSSSSSSPSDSDADVEGGDASGSGSGPEDAAENGWTWSTGAAPGATLARGATAKKKKPILMPGEKRSLKKRHMAELRAARAEVRNGWTPQDVKRELESMVAAGRREWTPPGGGVRAADAKIIRKLARCYPNLRCDSETSAASGRKKRAYVRVVNLAHPVNHGGAEVDAERGAFSGRGRALGGGGDGGGDDGDGSAISEINPAASARAAEIAAPVPTREKFLADPVRLARLARFLGRGRVEGTAGEGTAVSGAAASGPSRRGAGRGGVDGRGNRTRGLAGHAPVFSSAGIVDGIGGGVARAAAEEEEDGEDDDAMDVAGRVSGMDRAPRHLSSYAADFGAFEAHTTGFGSRLMRRMGYVEGGGLGPNGRGISEPVSQSRRPKNLGLGATGAG